MARKLVDVEEAARLLGVGIEEINAMRDRKELFPYRDGEAWKYKVEDIERLKQERSEAKSESWIGSDAASIPLEVNEDVESILLSEKELGPSGRNTSSTIIGKSGQNAPSEDADIRLAPLPGEGTSDVGLSAMKSGTGSDVKLVLSPSDSGKKREPGSSLSDLTINLAPAGGSSKKGGSSKAGGSKAAGSAKGGGSDLLSSAEAELKLADAGAGSSTKGGRPASDKSKRAEIKRPDFDDDLELAEEDVLSAKPGSDITAGATDSGINLVDPKDSGISLEQPLELGGSSVELMELGEADVISLEDSADVEGATQLRSDDDFLLTPVRESSIDESDSGSQVIALDSEEDVGSGAFTPASSGMVAMLEEDTGGYENAAMPAGAMSTGPALMSTPSVPEAPFSGWNVLGLVCCVLLLLMTGMVMQDTIRNIWKWDTPYPINDTLMTSVERSIGWMEPTK
jgi:hypothetical protein